MSKATLIQLQNKLNAPKSQFNKFGKYNYRNLEDILTAVKPLCIECGILINLSDELVMIGDRYYIKATCTAMDHEKGEVIATSVGYAREAESKKGMDESQITGAASSYARKLAIGSLLLIDDTKDSDTPTDSKPSKPAEKAKQKPLSLEQGENLNRLLVETDTDLNTMITALKIKTVDPDNFEMVMDKLQQKHNKMQSSGSEQ